MLNDGSSTEPPIRLSLRADVAAVRAGEVPAFTLTVHNDGDRPERVLDLSGGRRRDLQDTYYELEVWRAGRVLADIPRMISDPGPVREDDFVVLGPGGKLELAFTRFAAGLQFLPPGEYRARIRFRQYPLQPPARDLFSPFAAFTVLP